MDPKDVEAYNNRGIAYRDKGALNSALTDFNEAIKIAPKFALTYINRSALYHEKGDLENALSDCNEALRLLEHNVK